MDTSINNIEYVHATKRAAANSIDIFILLFIRIVIAQILGFLWINKSIEDLLNNFQNHFGTEEIKNTAEHIEFIMSSSAFYNILFLYFVMFLIGVFYNSCLNSSLWSATIGKRIMNFMIVDNDFKKIRFRTALLHYFLAILPIIFLIYLIHFQFSNKLTLFQAITSSPITVAIGFGAVLWMQIQIFTKKRTTAYDMICKVVFVKGRANEKYPWKFSRSKKND